MDIKYSDGNVAKRQKIEEYCVSTKQGASTPSCIELVLFNTDSLFKIASYLHAVDLLNLALTCKRFGMAAESNDSLSLIEETSRRIVQDISTEERPKIEGESWLANYHYLRSVVIFDHLLHAEYEEGNRSCFSGDNVAPRLPNNAIKWPTGFSNNIMKRGKHYVSFDKSDNGVFLAGIMRHGKVQQKAHGNPLIPSFYENFVQSADEELNHGNVHCCMFYNYLRKCYVSDWEHHASPSTEEFFQLMEQFTLTDELGLLLDLDEGTLAVYKNGQRLQVVRRGLAGQYCWVVSYTRGKVSIKRGIVPSS